MIYVLCNRCNNAIWLVIIRPQNKYLFLTIYISLCDTKKVPIIIFSLRSETLLRTNRELSLDCGDGVGGGGY